MHWTRLLLGAWSYKQTQKRYVKGVRDYGADPHGPLNWWSDGCPTDEQASSVLGLANKPGCRLTLTPELPSWLSASLRDCRSDLAPLRDRSLWDAELSDTEKAQIKHSYESILEVLPKQSHTAVSKIIHWFNPCILPLWDNTIRSAYDCHENAADYAEKFMPRLHAELREAVASFMSDAEIQSDCAVGMLEDAGGGNLLDLGECSNFMRFTRGVDELWAPLPHDVSA